MNPLPVLPRHLDPCPVKFSASMPGDHKLGLDIQGPVWPREMAGIGGYSPEFMINENGKGCEHHQACTMEYKQLTICSAFLALYFNSPGINVNTKTGPG